jgi:predicted NUDIX family NTP pyrophosphohydrolase
MTSLPTSAGILLFRRAPDPEVLLVHPGGPFWRRRDQGAWQIPKGVIEPGESAETAARREVAEELGIAIVEPLTPLGTLRQAGGKRVEAFALERDFDPATLRSNLVEIEWPKASGRLVRFPEIDAARWMTISQARRAMLASQQVLLDRLAGLIE